MARTDIFNYKEQILKWIEQKQSKAFISKELKCKPETLDKYLSKMGIVYRGIESNQGKQISKTYKTSLEYLQNENVKSHILKKKLIRDGIKEPKCEECLNDIWNGKPIPLELHHKDGNHYNNNIDNLILLCPNCHAQKENNAGAALKKKHYCIKCHIKEVSKKGLQCRSCAAKAKSSCPYTREELKEQIRSFPFTVIGKKNNVSDNAVRKWCDSKCLPRTKAAINSYSDKEWESI